MTFGSQEGTGRKTINANQTIHSTTDARRHDLRLWITVLAVLWVPQLLWAQGASDDDGIFEVGVAYISDFPGKDEDRPGFKYAAEDFYSRLTGAGWSGNFKLGEQYAWETWFKDGAHGGIENVILDNADIALLATHGWAGVPGSDPSYPINTGSLSALDFTPNAKYISGDDGFLMPGEAIQSWGDHDLEWLVLESCSVLTDRPCNGIPTVTYWANSMKGMHLMLGFSTIMYCYNDGFWLGIFACGGGYINGKLLIPKTLLQAWFETIDIRQPGEVTGRVVADAYDNFNDHLWGKGYVSADPLPDPYYWICDHKSAKASGAGSGATGGHGLSEVLLYDVVERDVDEGYVLDLGQAFGLSGEVGEADREVYNRMMADEDGRQLTVDRTTGMYFFGDFGRLWIPPETAPELPDAEAAAMLARNHLNERGLLPEDAVMTDVITEGFSKHESETGAEVERRNTHQQVVFERHLPMTAEGQTVPVHGPGAKMMTYVDAEGLAGVRGGWREVREVGTIEIMDPQVAWERYEMHGDAILTQPISTPHDEVEIQDTYLVYFEQGMGVAQQSLIPTWCFEVEFFANGVSQGTGQLHMAAHEAFLPLLAEITNPWDGDTFIQGDSVQLAGLAHFGVAPYTYSWESNVDGHLENGAELTCDQLSVAMHEDQVVHQIITLTVTDATGQTAQQSVSITVQP